MLRWVRVSRSLRSKLVEFHVSSVLLNLVKKKINVRLLFWVIKATLVSWSDRKNIFVSLIWVRSTRLFLLFEHFPCSSSEDSMKSLKRRTNIPDKVFKRIEKCSRCYNAYLLSQTSRRVPLAAGFHLNQIVSWFLLAMILYFPRSLQSLPRKLHQQRRTIHHAKIDHRKEPFLLNTSCYRQITLQALQGRHAPTKLFA